MHPTLSQDYASAVVEERLAIARRQQQVQMVRTSAAGPVRKALRGALALAVTAVVGGLGSADAQASTTPGFTDWSAASSATDTASGVLRGVPVKLSGGDVHTAVLDGTFTGFASASAFSPALSTSDTISLGSRNTSQTVRITFDAAVKDPVLHLASLASELTFPPGTTIHKLRGQDSLTVEGPVVKGSATGSGHNSDSNGTIQLAGSHTTITITTRQAPSAPNGDGFYLQIGTLFPS